MKTFKLQRFLLGSDFTAGELTESGQHIVYTLERPDKNNQAKISCIPVGVYECSYVAVSPGGHIKDCYSIKNVKDRSAIFIHRGNTVSDIQGCILFGKTIQLGGLVKLLQSDLAICYFHNYTSKQDFLMDIRQ